MVFDRALTDSSLEVGGQGTIRGASALITVEAFSFEPLVAAANGRGRDRRWGLDLEGRVARRIA